MQIVPLLDLQAGRPHALPRNIARVLVLAGLALQVPVYFDAPSSRLLYLAARAVRFAEEPIHGAIPRDIRLLADEYGIPSEMLDGLIASLLGTGQVVPAAPGRLAIGAEHLNTNWWPAPGRGGS